MGRKHQVDISEVDTQSTKRRRAVQGISDTNPWTGKPYSSRYFSILDTRTKLPVYQFKDELVKVVKVNQTVVLEGETGSGTYIQARGLFLAS